MTNTAITQNAETQAAISPSEAISMLKEGNQRFLNNSQLSRNNHDAIKATSGGQWPFAAIVECIDSRVPGEQIFDQGIGDIFNVRIAGNFVNHDMLGSLEYSCKVAGSKAIVVLGHTHCGAVKAACDHVELGNITGMLKKIEPAVNQVAEKHGDFNSSNGELVQEVVENNVINTIQTIHQESPILHEMASKGEIAIVGAVYDVESGVVTFMD